MGRQKGCAKPARSGRKAGTPNKSNFLADLPPGEPRREPWRVWLAVLNDEPDVIGLPADYRFTLAAKLKASAALASYLYPTPRPPRDPEDIELKDARLALAKERLENMRLTNAILRAELEGRGLTLEEPPFDPAAEGAKEPPDLKH